MRRRPRFAGPLQTADSGHVCCRYTVQPHDAHLSRMTQSSQRPTSVAVFVPLRATDAEGSTVTLTVTRTPMHGTVHPDGGGPEAVLSSFSGGGVVPSQIVEQHATDVLAVSSWWPWGSSYHPFQALGPRGVACPHNPINTGLSHLLAISCNWSCAPIVVHDDYCWCSCSRSQTSSTTAIPFCRGVPA